MIWLRESENRQALLVKEARFARVLELWHKEHLSTHCISGRLGIDENEVCRLIEEGESQCWRDRRVS
jgi:DNA-binding transcriptional regulator LsrR (DeoR family)